MKANVYDFDKTIYDGDSSIDFYIFCLKEHPSIIFLLPKQVYAVLLYKLKIVKKEKMKEEIFSFLKKIKDIDKIITKFWESKFINIKDWYLNTNHKNDIIISASPYFLLEECCKRLGVKKLIATEVDKISGKFLSNNCYGEEKVIRLKEEYPNVIVEKMYTDSLSDLPLLNLSKEGYLVEKNKITDYKEKK